ncbi:hypothetical protein [Bacillus sp. FJAT-45350]|uniref:hypothetical protein n=1 Tax=Bacillus sp. FJAT-45350 TaxID=2011014 RepID=UPI000BB6BEC8|nr:hypothetical protein [Bacillus sp. FJAT-45350]
MDSYKDIKIEDEEVVEHWREWEAIEDEESTEIEIKRNWGDKQIALATMRKRKKKLVEGVYESVFEEYTHLVHRTTGKCTHYNNRKYYHEVRGECIYLIDYFTKKEKVVYDGKGFITTSGDWLMDNKQPLSDKDSLGVLYPVSDLRVSKLCLKNSQIITSLFWGQKVIDQAIDGENRRTHDINHRNLEHDDDRPENLEIVTLAENNEHRKIMTKLKKDKFKKLQDE